MQRTGWKNSDSFEFGCGQPSPNSLVYHHHIQVIDLCLNLNFGAAHKSQPGELSQEKDLCFKFDQYKSILDLHLDSERSSCAHPPTCCGNTQPVQLNMGCKKSQCSNPPPPHTSSSFLCTTRSVESPPFKVQASARQHDVYHHCQPCFELGCLWGVV